MLSTTRTVLFFSALIGTAVHAQQPLKRFVRPDAVDSLETAKSAIVEQQLVVMLKLADDPVAVVRSRAPAKQLAAADEQAIANDLERKQDAMIPLIEARGGTVRTKMQHAVNGITVRIPASRLAAMATIPGVVGVKPVATYRIENAESVPFIGADATWGGTPGFRGEGIKIFVIDTGIDYTHANFGGPGPLPRSTWPSPTAPSPLIRPCSGRRRPR